MSDVVHPLTPMQVKVLGFVAMGRGNKEIARSLGISTHTIKNHIAAAMSRLEAPTRCAAVVDAIRQGSLRIEG